MISWLSVLARRLTWHAAAALVLLAVGTSLGHAHSVSVGYVTNGTNSITIYYGSYHSGTSQPEGTVSLIGPVTLSQVTTNVVATKPAGLIDGTNNFYAGSCNGGSLGTPIVWESATFTNVPSGTYSIQLTGSFTINWQPCDASISSGAATFVIDTNPPVITSVPGNITVYTPANSNQATATWTAPVATDNISVASFTSNYGPGSSFPVGTTTVTYTARDAVGNTTTASFTVTVIDNVPPVIANLPANISLTPSGASSTVVATWTSPTATDNVGVASFTSNYTPGAGFPLGVTTVTYRAVDTSGNQSAGRFTVTVADSIPPVITSCPASQTIEATSVAGAVANWTPPAASDNSGTATLTGSSTSGATFPLGTTTVTYTATDPSNNAAIPCTFTITVRDTTPPSLPVISNIVVTAPDLTGANVNFSLPAATDLTDPNVTVTSSPAPGAFFAVGVHTVTVTAVDRSKNQTIRTFTITVVVPGNLVVTPGTDLISSGPQGEQGAAFTPNSQNYTVTNNGQAAMDFTVTGAPAWVSVSPASGTLAPGASSTVRVSLSGGADALAAGNYVAPLSFNNATNGIGTTIRNINLTVLAPANLVVVQTSDFIASGPQGGQGGSFSPTTMTYTVQNTGALPMNFTVTGQPSWVAVSPASGTVPPGSSVNIMVTLNAGADSLPAGTSTGMLTFTNTTNNAGTVTRGVRLDVQQPARLVVTAADGLDASGYQGGPFAPAAKAYTLSNSGGIPLSFSVTDDRTWIDVAGGTGTIQPGGSSVVTVSINSTANALASGTYTGITTFTNIPANLGNTTRPVSLKVIPNGQVVLKVVTTDGDGVFQFASQTSALTLALTTSSGSAQSAPVALTPGTYSVTATPPDGFGLTSITCSNTANSGSLAAKTATFTVAASETLVCTFASVNSRKKTIEVIQKFMSRRNDLVLSNGPDTGRQVDRLIEAGDRAAGRASGGAGTSSGAPANGLGGEASVGVGALGAGRPAIASAARSSLVTGPEQTSSWPGPSQAGGPPGTSASSDQDQGPSRFAFATSLSQMMRLSAESDQRKLDEARKGSSDAAVGPDRLPSSRPAFSPWDVWLQASYTRFTDDRGGAASSGYFGVLHVGADYILNPYVLFGLQGQFDNMRQHSNSDASNVDGRGWMAGPYGTFRLSEHLFLQARAAAGQSTNAVSPYLTYTDHFSTTRWLASATLVGRWQYEAWDFRPSASVSYIEDVSKAYTDSLGVSIPGIKSSLGQMKVGPEIHYRYQMADGTSIIPHASAQAIWNFAGDSTGADFGGSLAGPKEVRGRVELGIKVKGTQGIQLDVSSSYDGIGSSSFQAIGGKATLRIPLN